MIAQLVEFAGVSARIGRAADASVTLAALALFLGCGGSGDSTPTAQSVVMQLDEDQLGTVVLTGNDPRGKQLTFHLAGHPANGIATLDAATGHLMYRPNDDYFGSDSLTFMVINSRGRRSSTATVSMTINAINDAPVVYAPSTAVNSAYTFETIIPFNASDVDSPTLQYALNVTTQEVIAARIDSENSAIVVSPKKRGGALITLSVGDATDTAKAEIEFQVTDVQKSVVLSIDEPEASAVSIHNSLDHAIEFVLEHNGFRSFRSVEDVAAYVEQIDAAYPGEPYVSKLWRFVRNNLFHDYVLTGETWIYDPLLVLNSLGWGLCGNAASLYVRIARAAGYEARVWELGGHVVPEVFTENAWQVYDPDLAVFYRNQDLSVAGMDTLSADLSLIAVPTSPIHDPSVYSLPYSEFVAEIYGTASDNSVAPQFDGPPHSLDGTVRLPAGATLIYPGLWDSGPIGHDGEAQQPVTWYRHALIEIPAGYSGSVDLPWLIRYIRGTGTVRINDVIYSTDSIELQSLLREPQMLIDHIDVIEATTDLGFVFYINAGQFRLTQETVVNVTGIDVWSAIVEKYELPEPNRIRDSAFYTNPKPRSLLEH
jgi:hypothetical protein